MKADLCAGEGSDILPVISGLMKQGSLKTTLLIDADNLLSPLLVTM